MFQKMAKNYSLLIARLMMVLVLCAQFSTIQHQVEHTAVDHVDNCEIFIQFENSHACVGALALAWSDQAPQVEPTASGLQRPIALYVRHASRDPPLA